MTAYRLEGSRVDGIGGLYAEFNRLFRDGADWPLGESLDGLNDVLYDVEGDGDEDRPVHLIWADHEHSRAALGVSATRAWLEDKLARPGVFDDALIRRRRDDLLAGRGATYFELVLEVFSDHPRILVTLS